MAGNKIVQIIKPENVGVELIRQGWRQGSLLNDPAAIKSWLALHKIAEQEQNLLGAAQHIWVPQHAPLNTDDIFIVASQTCDIQRSVEQEPYLEVIRGYWTTDRSIMHQAKKNSSRLFFLQSYLDKDGNESALVADATVHVSIEKTAFLTLLPQSSFKADDRHTPRKFSDWLARRYNRPALPDDIINAIQKPIVKAIDKLPKKHTLHHILDSVDEILFTIRNENSPLQIDMIFLYSKINDTLNEDIARLAAWIGGTLRKVGEAELVYYEPLSFKDISAYDYGNAIQLPLDYYSSWDDTAEK